MAESPETVMANSRNANNIVGRYVYPAKQSAHNMVLVFRDYSYNPTAGVIGQKVNKNTDASVVLPIPSNLQDTYSVQINPFELGAMGALAADALSGKGRGAAVDAANLAGGAFNNADGAAREGNVEQATGGLLSTLKTASAFVGRNALDDIGIGGVAAAVDVSTGTAVNPHVTLRFEGVNLKAHTFNWSMSPTNEREAETLKNLINYIRSKMLPAYDREGTTAISRGLLKYPSIVDIFFTGVDQDYFYYFKPAMINSFTTDYTPNGITLNKGGKPSFINMTMQLTEASIHTAGDVNVQG